MKWSANVTIIIGNMLVWSWVLAMKSSVVLVDGYWMGRCGPMMNGCWVPCIVQQCIGNVGEGGLGSRGVDLSYLIDAGSVGRRVWFVVWKCKLTWLDGFVGVWLLLSAITGCCIICIWSWNEWFFGNFGVAWSWNACNFVTCVCL